MHPSISEHIPEFFSAIATLLAIGFGAFRLLDCLATKSFQASARRIHMLTEQHKVRHFLNPTTGELHAENPTARPNTKC